MAGAGATEQRDEVSEFLKQNRQLAEWVEALRGECESEKHWAARRHFILRNLEGFDIKPPGGPFPNLNRLLSLSMVWANHVFLGCRYPQAVMEKVLELAEGIDVLDAPSRTTRDDLVVKMKKRGLSSSNVILEKQCINCVITTDQNKTPLRDSNDTRKKTSIKALERERKIIAGTIKKTSKITKLKRSCREALHINSNLSIVNRAENCAGSYHSSSSFLSCIGAKCTEKQVDSNHFAPTMAVLAPMVKHSLNLCPNQKTEEAKETCRKKKSAFKEDNGCSKNVRNEICGEARANHTNLQWQNPLPSTSSNQTVAKLVATLSGQRTIMTSNEKAINSHLMPPFAGHELQKQNLIPAPLESRLCTNFFHHVKNGSLQNSQPSPQECASKGGETSIIPSYKLTPETVKDRQTFYNRLYKAVAWKLVSAGGFSPNLNHLGILNSCIESIKATLDSYFLPLKDISDLPYNKASSENIVCELRCKSVYLGTGCGKSEENAKVVASREALKLFLKKKVIVKIMKRKYKGRDIEDLVLLDEESKPLNLPPALRNPQEIY
uniref:CDKN2A interacting protein n=1 Tax=Latimeria chalumnae TaxID=7897 RepID=H3AYU3_LATCH